MHTVLNTEEILDVQIHFILFFIFIYSHLCFLKFILANKNPRSTVISHKPLLLSPLHKYLHTARDYLLQSCRQYIHLYYLV